MTATQYLAVRYGRNTNSQPYGARSADAAEQLGDERKQFNSINLNHNWVLGGSKLNEFIFQYADFANAISANSLDPYHHVPERRLDRRRTSTRRSRRSRRSISSVMTSPGTSPDGRPRPRLQGRRELHQRAAAFHHVQHRHGRLRLHASDANDINGPISNVTLNGGDGRRQHPELAVRDLHPGRLAPDRSPDAESWFPLRLQRRLGDRPVQEPELRDPPERGTRRTSRGHAGVP